MTRLVLTNQLTAFDLVMQNNQDLTELVEALSTLPVFSFNKIIVPISYTP